MAKNSNLVVSMLILIQTDKVWGSVFIAEKVSGVKNH